MFDAENTDDELMIKVRATTEIPGTTIDPTGRIRGQWHEVVETVPGEPQAYAYWVARDDINAVGYKIIEHPSADADAMDLDLKHLTDNDGEV